MKPLCLCNCRRYPSSKLLGRRTGACLTARQWVKQSMTSGARALTQCGKKRVQMPGEPTLMWIFATSVCFWTVWLLDIFGKTCTVSVITVVLACDCDCVVSSSYTSAARYLSSMSSSSDAYIHTCIHTYMHTYIHTHIHTYVHTYIPTILPSRSFTISFVFPSFPVPAKTIEAHFRKNLTCGVIRSFNFFWCRVLSFYRYLRDAYISRTRAQFQPTRKLGWG